MTTNWQNSLTWREGLVKELPVKRLQTVSGNDGVEVILCEKVNKSLPLSLENIKRKQTIKSGEMGTAPFTFSEQYACLVIDTRRRTYTIGCNLKTQESVQGSLQLHVDYKVVDTHKVVFQSEDVLSQLIILCQKAVISVAMRRKYTQLDPVVFEDAVKGINVNHLGLKIEDVNITEPINWPSDITQIQSRIPVIEAEATIQARERALLREKLIDMGLSENVIKIVTASKDDDLNVIFSAAEKYSQSQKESREEAKQFLMWLSDKGYVSRTDLEENLVPGLLRKVEESILSEPDPTNFLLSSPSDNRSKNKSKELDSSPKESDPSTDKSSEANSDQAAETHSVNRIEGEAIIEKDQKSHSVIRRPAKPR